MSFSKSLKERANEIWEAAYQHPFVQELGKGTLPKEKFQFYLLQDYEYLKQYAKAFAMGAVRAKDEELIREFTKTQYYLLEGEMDLHREYMASFGISEEEMDQVKSSLYNRTYTANMQAIGQTGDLLDLLMTLFPCAWTYGDFATRLKEDYPEEYENNFYRSWIDTYAGEDFINSYQWFYDAIDEMVAEKTEEEKEELLSIFISSVEFEYLFWDMAYKMEMGYKL
ncbi:MAG: thiaminase II [Tissierellia bacterium]|nr:thiaminase II [Tissierellia bacterium]